MATATSARNLMSGSGTVSGTAGERRLTFSGHQGFKEGATIVVGSQQFTIDVGSDMSWQILQAIGTTITTQSFSTSDTSTNRGRGSTGVIVPGAMHFLYRAPLDSGGAPDWYFYFDTLFPENGVHPYTKDQYTGTSWLGSLTSPAQALVPNLGLRIRVLEGTLRGDPAANKYNGGTSKPDTRLSDLVNRVTLLEQWAGRVGTNSPPAVGLSDTYTVDQLQSFGDIA
jgi:hypothetical protein